MPNQPYFEKGERSVYWINILFGVNALLLFLRREVDRIEYGDQAGIILFNFRNPKFFYCANF